MRSQYVCNCRNLPPQREPAQPPPKCFSLRKVMWLVGWGLGMMWTHGPCLACFAISVLPSLFCHPCVAISVLPSLCCHLCVAISGLPSLCCHLCLPSLCCHLSVAISVLPSLCCHLCGLAGWLAGWQYLRLVFSSWILPYLCRL